MSVDVHQDHETVGKALDRRLLARLQPFARPYARGLLLGLLLLFLVAGLEMLGPWILRQAIDGPAGEAAHSADAGLPEGESLAPRVRLLVLWSAAYLAVAAVAAWGRYAQTMILNRSGQGILHDLRRALFSKLQRLPMAYFDRTPVGRLVTRVTSDVETLNELFTSGVVALAGDVVKILAMIVLLFVVNARLAVVAVVAVPVIAVASAFFRIRARQAYRETRTAIARVTSYLGESIAGARVLQSFAREDKARSRFAAQNAEYRRTNVRTIFYFALFFPVVDLIALSAQGAVFWRGGVEILGERLTIGEFIQFWYYLNLIFEPLRELAERYNVLQSAMASAERIFTVLDTAEEPADPAEPAPVDELQGRVEFDDVRFGYSGDAPVLDGVSFTIQPGETVALVGATGGGKTTISALLARHYEPWSGEIRVDGRPLSSYARQELRSRLAYVPQDVFLFTGTVLDNLRLDPRVSESRAKEAAREIGAESFIRRFPGGYDHRLSERGANLSAGERQILAFVRALAKDPAILVLDEATANVDPETEAMIQEAIPRLLRGRTSLVIAHRLSTIRHADRILVLHKGKIREQGTHDELLKKDGLYSRLHRLQFEAV